MSLTETTTVSLRSPDRFFVGGTWVKPSSSGGHRRHQRQYGGRHVPGGGGQGRRHGRRRRRRPRSLRSRSVAPPEPCQQRADYLRKIASALDERSLEVSGDLVGPDGRPALDGQGQWPPASESLSVLRGPGRRRSPSRNAHARQPAGMSGFWSGSRLASSAPSSPGTGRGSHRPQVAPALLAGCTVVLKSSPEAPGEGYVLAEIAEAIGLPPGRAERRHRRPGGLRAAGARPRVDKITFTGSTAAGRRIASTLRRAHRPRARSSSAGSRRPWSSTTRHRDGAPTRSPDRACMLTGQVCSSLTRIVVTQSGTTNWSRR